METIDTLYNAQCEATNGVIDCTLFFDYISLGDILTIASMFLTFCLFKKQLKETRNENVKGIKAQWFLEVVVEPNLEIIRRFYEDTVSNVKQSVITLNNSFPIETAQNFSIILAKEKRKYKDDLKDELGHVRSLINATKPELSKNIDANLDELVDIITTLLDDHQSYDITRDVKNKLMENQTKMLAILYTTIGNLQSDDSSKIKK